MTQTNETEEKVNDAFYEYLADKGLTHAHPIYINFLKEQFVLGYYERRREEKFEFYHAGSYFKDHGKMR